MKNYLEERLDELRKKYRDTGDSKWLHRFNECHHIREKFIIDHLTSKVDSGPSERRQTTTPYPGNTSTDNDRGLV